MSLAVTLNNQWNGHYYYVQYVNMLLCDEHITKWYLEGNVVSQGIKKIQIQNSSSLQREFTPA
jgi:hypothetical protein